MVCVSEPHDQCGRQAQAPDVGHGQKSVADLGDLRGPEVVSVAPGDDDVFELRLYEKGRLIALEPCATPERAFELSIVWRDNAPPWPAF